MDISVFLARLIGIYLILMTFLYIARKDFLYEAFDDYFSSPALILVTSAFNLIFGLLLVLSHSVWEMSWRVLITLIGYLVLFKGVVGLFAPDGGKSISDKYKQGNWFMANIVLWFFIGLYLLYEGFLAGH